MNDDVASALRGLYAKFGEQILTQPPRLASLLRDECPERRPEISALVKALEEQVPQHLLNSRSGEPPRSLAARLSKRLSEQHLLAREACNWAVWAWAHGLGLGDDYRSDPEEHQEPRSQVIDPEPLQQGSREQGPLVVPRRSQWPIWATAAAVLMAVGLAAHAFFKSPPPPPPHIASIDAPSRIRVGKPYTFAIRFDRAPAGVVAVERHVVQSSIKWAEDTNNVKVAGLEAQSQGTVQYAFEPEPRPSKTTLEFVLIDRNGQRSQPQTVSYDILPVPVVCNECGTISDIEKFQQRRKATGFGAAAGAVVGGLFGSLIGKGRGKDVAVAAGAVGGGLAGNAIEGHMTASHWEVTVRLNNGRKQVIQTTTEPDWHIGERVKVIHGEILPM